MNSQKASNFNSSLTQILRPSSTTTIITTSSIPLLSSKLINKTTTRNLISFNEEIELESNLSSQSNTLIPQNYSQYSLSNKIILSILKCIIYLSKLNYQWNDFQFQNKKREGGEERGGYCYHHYNVNSNPLTESLPLYLLLIIPLFSHLQVTN